MIDNFYISTTHITLVRHPSSTDGEGRVPNQVRDVARCDALNKCKATGFRRVSSFGRMLTYLFGKKSTHSLLSSPKEAILEGPYTRSGLWLSPSQPS